MNASNLNRNWQYRTTDSPTGNVIKELTLWGQMDCYVWLQNQESGAADWRNELESAKQIMPVVRLPLLMLIINGGR